MDTYEIIKAKRDGKELDQSSIRKIVRGFTDGSIADYQMSAWLMAVWFNGMNSQERAGLTREMVETGTKLNYPKIDKALVDKHSTGGVGDGVSLSLVPLVASFGVKIPMMSGRGLGHTGGTLDKLESIPGFEVYFNQEQINTALNEVGAIIMGQTDEVAPADGKMYSLRDVTATIDSVDLIASSIMSKKIAEGMDALVLDVKTGSGAFMEDFEDAIKLGRSMVEIGRELGKNMEALITDMDQPLGESVGNAIEMQQHIELLKGNGPTDLTELVKWLAGVMLSLDGLAESREAGYDMAGDRLDSGDAVQKLKQIISHQGGEPSIVDDYSLFPEADHTAYVEADDDGFVNNINAYEVGMAARALGAGRQDVNDEIDHAAGIKLHKKVGDPVDAGEILYELHYNDSNELNLARRRLRDSIDISTDSVDPQPLIHGLVSQNGKFESLEINR